MSKEYWRGFSAGVFVMSGLSVVLWSLVWLIR